MTSEYLNLNGGLAISGPEFDPMKHLPLINPLEQRALSLKFAIDAKAYSLFGKDDTPTSIARSVVDAAKVFQAYLAGEPAEIRDLDDEL